jgi:GAF domain-containing protein
VSGAAAFSTSVAAPFEVVAAVAQLIGETLELRQVFARVAEAARGALAFDRMSVLLLVDADTVRHYAVAGTGADRSGAEEGRLVQRADCSPRLWGEFVVDRVDTERELDPAYARDREILAAGARSIIRAVLRSGGQRLGILAFFSREPQAFAGDDEPLVATLADLVAAELEHERLWRIERERSRRATALEGLLPTLAQALDIRQVFKQVSEITQDVIPHDLLVLSLLQPDGASVGTHALLPGGELEELPTPNASLLALYKGALVRDISVVDPRPARVKLFPLASDGEPLQRSSSASTRCASATLATLVSGPWWRCRCRSWGSSRAGCCSSRGDPTRTAPSARTSRAASPTTSPSPSPTRGWRRRRGEPWKRGCWPRGSRARSNP